jgi:hypothetical protein
MDVIDRGLAVRMVTREEVVAAIEDTIARHSSADEAQRRLRSECRDDDGFR